MNEKLEYYYQVLGLKPGAAPGEIKSAYRRLVKVYHPDRDNSPDTLSMYKEIHIAYKALFNQATIGESDINSVNNRNYSKKTSQTSGYSYKKAQQSNANSTKETSQDSSYSSERAKQSSANNRGNFNQQPTRIEKYKSKLFIMCMAIAMFYELIYGIDETNMLFKLDSNMISLLFITSWILFVFYYFKPSTWPGNLMRITAAIIYGLVFPFLIAYFCLFAGGFIETIDLVFIWYCTVSFAFVLVF